MPRAARGTLEAGAESQNANRFSGYKYRSKHYAPLDGSLRRGENVFERNPNTVSHLLGQLDPATEALGPAMSASGASGGKICTYRDDGTKDTLAFSTTFGACLYRKSGCTYGWVTYIKIVAFLKGSTQPRHQPGLSNDMKVWTEKSTLRSVRRLCKILPASLPGYYALLTVKIHCWTTLIRPGCGHAQPHDQRPPWPKISEDQWLWIHQHDTCPLTMVQHFQPKEHGS
jgi:hypothetical protein